MGHRCGCPARLSSINVLKRLRPWFESPAGPLIAARVEGSVGGNIDQAQEAHQLALTLAREIGSSLDEASALAGLGRCALAAGRTAAAETSLRQAQEVFQRIGAAGDSSIARELNEITGTGKPQPSNEAAIRPQPR